MKKQSNTKRISQIRRFAMNQIKIVKAVRLYPLSIKSEIYKNSGITNRPSFKKAFDVVESSKVIRIYGTLKEYLDFSNVDQRLDEILKKSPSNFNELRLHLHHAGEELLKTIKNDPVMSKNKYLLQDRVDEDITHYNTQTSNDYNYQNIELNDQILIKFQKLLALQNNIILLELDKIRKYKLQYDSKKQDDEFFNALNLIKGFTRFIKYDSKVRRGITTKPEKPKKRIFSIKTRKWILKEYGVPVAYPSSIFEFYSRLLDLLKQMCESEEYYYRLIQSSTKRSLRDIIDVGLNFANVGKKEASESLGVGLGHIRNILNPILDESKLPYYELDIDKIKHLQKLERGHLLIDEVTDEEIMEFVKQFRYRVRLDKAESEGNQKKYRRIKRNMKKE